MQNAQAGPSTQSQPAKKKAAESVTSAKRKRTNTPEDSASEASGQQPRKARDGPKKKKANRACFHCQKAHLTCDDCTCLSIAVTHTSLSHFSIQPVPASAVSSAASQTAALKVIEKRLNTF
jgi:hypothetical protein